MCRISTLYTSEWAIQYGPKTLNQLANTLRTTHTNLLRVINQISHPWTHQDNPFFIRQTLEQSLAALRGTLNNIDYCLHDPVRRALHGLKGTFEAQDVFNELYVIAHGVSAICQPLEGGNTTLKQDFKYSQAASVINGRIEGLLA